MGKECMLTTFDNPYNPFDDFTSWFMFDIEKGYNTCSYLGRIVNLSDDLCQKEVDEEVERAIDEIIFYDFRNIYKKVYKDLKSKRIRHHTILKGIEGGSQK